LTPSLPTVQLSIEPPPGSRQEIRLVLNRLDSQQSYTFESAMQFVLDGAALRDIRSGKLSPAVTEAFRANSVQLSSQVALASLQPGCWRLTDSGLHRAFLIRADSLGGTAAYGLDSAPDPQTIAFRLDLSGALPPGQYLVRVQTGGPPFIESELTRGVLAADVTAPSVLTEDSIAAGAPEWLKPADFTGPATAVTVAPGRRWLLTDSTGAHLMVRGASGNRLQIFRAGEAGGKDRLPGMFLAPLVVIPKV
jgi:hypothetical protein